MRRLDLTTLCLTVAFACPALPAHAASCSDLWYSRNAIYKEAGYCFRTAAAIRAFGNAGCQYDDVDAVPLSAQQRRDVAEIVGEEQNRGCR